MTNPETPAPLPTSPPKKSRGCFFYGCITSLIILLVVVLGIFFTVRYALHKANALIAEYTETSPMALPKVEMSDAELKALKDRVAVFQTALDAHTNTPPLVLTGPEINALLANSADLKDYRDKFSVALDGEEIKSQVSLPLETLPKVPPMNWLDLKGRYLNGSGNFKVAIENGKLSVFVESLEVHGKPLPAEFMKAFQQQNLADGFNNGPKGAMFERYDSVKVKDSTLTVKAKEN